MIRVELFVFINFSCGPHCGWGEDLELGLGEYFFFQISAVAMSKLQENYTSKRI